MRFLTRMTVTSKSHSSAEARAVAASSPLIFKVLTLEASRPLRRIAAPAEVAAAIAYLASDDTRYMTGAALTLGGGIAAGA